MTWMHKFQYPKGLIRLRGGGVGGNQVFPPGEKSVSNTEMLKKW